ncbi:hypothetical protein LCGC14_0549820 [marine sediment metagenome]|uniref:PD-(D/E)XK endonuclease-like domain-containing protein n=1 Tax=marine sediment metagenome TaxID=412755 RepID=A0A0F9RQD1_9ZZZZ
MTETASPLLLNLDFKDNSRLSEFKLCPRKFWFHYIQHLVPAYPRYPLDFGSAWHKGMDFLYINFFENGIRGIELGKIAFEGFLQEWAELGHPPEIPIGDEVKFKARTPGTAREMFMNYVKTRTQWLETLELVEVELPFAVPIDPDKPNRWLVGRLDKIIKEKGYHWVVEHKTNSLYSIEHGMQAGFTDMFDPNAQVDGYGYALKMLYGAKSMGVLVDAALVHKTHHDIFKFIPVNKAVGFASQWLEDTIYWWDRVEEAEEGKHYARNCPSACRTVYGACEYKGICNYTTGHKDFDEAPAGYKFDKWEPFSFDELKKAMGAEKVESEVI